MASRIKKCSNFLIESEFRRINKKIRLMTENLNDNDLNTNEENLKPKEEIIKNTVNSIESINKITDEKKKEVLDDLRVKKIGAQSQDEYEEFENQESKFLDDIDLEGEKKAADIVWEIIPKKTDTIEVSAEKIDTTYSIFDQLTKNAKKFLLVTCIGLLGWNVASNLFSQKTEAKKILDDVKKSGVSFDDKLNIEPPLKIFKIGEIGAGGSIGEIPENSKKEIEKTDEKEPKKTTNKKLETEKKRLSKKFVLLDPSTMKTTDYFDRKKTVFLSAKFPYKISNKYNIDTHFEDDRRDDIRKKYIPALDEAAKGEKMGLKLLALVMTYMEGYRKGTTSYVTNNPGNINNTDSGRRYYLKSLEKGVKLQLNYLKDAASGKDVNYPIGDIVSRPAEYSMDPNLRRWIPGMVFEYEGTLEQFLRVYATGCRNDNNYLNVVLSFFEVYFPGKVTRDTKVKDIINLGETGKVSTFIQKNKKEKEEVEKKEKEEAEKKEKEEAEKKEKERKLLADK